ncbi:hypothetical protein PVAP13_6NG042180 [Panicum virgatum]|uniref:WRKY domain-containing protein n=1 Tax=Panicum virgatum TaxID=38727 RepID=A0A8T0QUQ0_PANVG|nr:hypothetical protein PVAP13_6NG042180 [Panicum virgatum]
MGRAHELEMVTRPGKTKGTLSMCCDPAPDGASPTLPLLTGESVPRSRLHLRILGDTRGSLTPQMLEALVSAKDWLTIVQDKDKDKDDEDAGILSEVVGGWCKAKCATGGISWTGGGLTDGIKGYYKCSSVRGCPARKHVDWCVDDPSMLIVTYEGDHNHNRVITQPA